MRKLLVILILLYVTVTNAQTTSGEPITITGDSLVGKIIQGEAVREVYGNVIIRQGKITITCDKAIQYISKNDAILEGNVVVTQDTLTIKAPRGYYYGNTRFAEGHEGVVLNDGKVELSAVYGDYSFNEDKAFFADNVRLYDTVSTLTSNTLTYFKELDKAIAVGEVEISDSINTIEADSLVHTRRDKVTFAENNVRLSNTENNIVVYGHHLEDYSKRDYTLIEREPLLVQIDTVDNQLDTLMISALKMEAFNDTTGLFIATDSVRIFRNDLSSKNRKTIYKRTTEEIITYKQSDDDPVPVMWYGVTQLSGDSIDIFLEDNRLSRMEVFRNAFILSHHENYPKRFDQVSGDTVTIYFDSTGIDYTDVEGGVLSFYYSYDSNDPNGLIKSSSQRARIYFKDDEVNEVKLYISPVSEFYPENLVAGSELSFTLPTFVIQKGRPEKKDFLQISNTRFVRDQNYQPELSTQKSEEINK